jgi:hypothetical protein
LDVGFGFKVQGLELGVWDVGFKFYNLQFAVHGVRLNVYCSGFRVGMSVFEFRIQTC